MRRRLASRAAFAVLMAPILLAACGEADPAVEAAERREIAELDADLPTRIAGFRVEEEDISDALADSRRPYLDAAALYSFREEDDLLQATLQVGRFADDVEHDDEDFRTLLVNNIGASARQVRMGDQELYVTGADRQTLSIWFEDGHLYVFSTREGFPAGRTLLRALLEDRS